MVAGRALFGSCRWILSEWLPRFGVETTVVDAIDLDAWKNAVQPNTKVFLVETPANPLLEITDIQAVADIAHAAGAKLIVDNVFATPIFQKPLTFGADIVVYSATKHALEGMTIGRGMSFLLLPAGVTANESPSALAKGTTPTPRPRLLM